MDLQKILEGIREEFRHRLEAKTGWGRSEVLAAYDSAVQAVVVAAMEAIARAAKT